MRVAETTHTPGGRYSAFGEFSGEEFRETVLRPAYLEAVQGHVPLEVQLDGTSGYSTAFLEEAFGGLAREFGSHKVSNVLRFVSKSRPMLPQEILGYIQEANL